MKSLPRLALGALFAGMLAVSTHAVTLTTAGSNSNPSGGISGYWNITVPSTVNITTSVSVTANSSSGAAGGSGISRVGGGGGTGVSVSQTGYGTKSASNAAYNQPAGNYTVSQGFGGPPNTVYGSINTTLTW